MQPLSKKHVIIYESSSFGGCFEYSLKLFQAFKDEDIKTQLLLPSNISYTASGVQAILPVDKIKNSFRVFKKIHFLIRQVVSPLYLFFYLLRKKSSLVILNDFEQISAPLWVPLFYIFLSKHKFGIVLHDPDRDHYPPSKVYSEYCMRLIMGLMDFAFYHGHLPDKPYYKRSKTVYREIPHGIYPLPSPDVRLLEDLNSRKKNGHFFMSILGNIREEKNYNLAIQALDYVPGTVLIIAGTPSHSAIDIDDYKKLAEKIGVAGRIIWITKYLSEPELAAVIDSSDLILLNYSRSFTSQSGILNLIAPFRKNIIASKTQSSLSILVERFQLGRLIIPDKLESLVVSINEYLNKKDEQSTGWDKYIQYSSWSAAAQIIYNSLNSKDKI